MAQEGKKIVKLDVKALIGLMNKALADEWLAYYQYWIGSKIISGPFMEEVAKELEEHAGEELKHANMLTDRIIILGGKPILNPNQWSKLCNCKYLEPTSFATKALLKQNIAGERCAIDVYQKLVDLTEKKDPISYHMFLSILEEEVEHEEDLQKFLDALGKK